MEENNNINNEATETTDPITEQNTGTETPEKKVPTADELSLALAQLKAENAKFKNSITKLTKENKSLNEWKTARMTAEEKETEEQAKAKAEHDAEFKRLQDFEQITLKTNKYIGMGMNPALAREAAQAELDNDNEKLADYYKQFNEDQLKAAKAEWLKSRPEIQEQATEEAVQAKSEHDAFFSD